MVYYCDSLLINLMMSLFLSWRTQISSICSPFFIKCNVSLPHSHPLVSKPLHGRYLYSNAITSIPSGAFTGLTALQYLWGRGGCYTFVWIDCVIYYFRIPSLSKRVCFRFVRSCNGIILWLALYLSLITFFFVSFFRRDRKCLPSALLFFIKCSLSLSSSHALVSNLFHDRALSSNAITSIPSGAFTGLTALQQLWGRGGLLYLCVDRLCYLLL